MSEEDFHRSVADAQEWMQAVHERLHANDNTQGPRAALEARLQETEKICQLEPEGRVKVDLVLGAAEALLASCHETQKPDILARLKDIKAQWEETVTYMTHCHSRIEWVWLHWSEYLLARDEFYRWFHKLTVTLEPPVELQLGLQEKRWQLSHAQVLLQNVDHQAVLLERLLEEAASLFHRIGDPSVDEDAQKRMQVEYDTVRTKAQDRVHLLAQVVQEHEQYQANVDEFQLWLQAVVEKAHSCLGRNRKLSPTHRLSALQDIARDFPRGEESLQRLEEQSVGIIQNTSPLGAEKVAAELEDMRKVLEKLRMLWEEEEERLQGLLRAEGACEQRAQQLEAELGEFRKRLHGLAQEGLEPAAMAKAGTEDELVARWRRCTAMQAALALEEPRVERLQAQLKELLVFPHHLQPLSKSVVAAIQDYQSLKGKNTRMRNTVGAQLWQRFQRPLQDLQLWKALAQRLLEVTASLPDLPSIHTFLPQIEAALVESSRLKEQLTMLQLKKDLLGSVFDRDRAAALLEEVASLVRDRDLLHNSLLQRKSKLQSLLAQHQDFGAALEPLQRKLLDLKVQLLAEKELQRDLPEKQAQLSRLQGLQEEGLQLGAQVESVKSLVQENSSHQHRWGQLSSDCQALQRALEDLVDDRRQSVREHFTFSHELLELRQWIAMLTEKLEARQGDGASQEAEVERLLEDFPEKEAQLLLTEAHGRLVLEKSSQEGARGIQEQLRELTESWQALQLLKERVLSFIRDQQLQRTDMDSGKGMVFTNNIPKPGFLIDPADPLPRHRRGAHLLMEEGGSREEPSRLLRDFKQWLQLENTKLVQIVAARASTAEDLAALELQELEAHVPEGQHLFESLLHLAPARETSEELEDVRYRWMLYKSKLRDSSHLLTLSSPGELPGCQKTRRRRGLGQLFRKACCTALPLQLLLLLLLLLLFLLPVGDEARSCTLANNLARSFTLMLRHHGPPPT
ncbi:nesprin-3 [Ochotona princeps]|uniref:nesprin-3 n=1 Tax=Ochotona princeps TaxID=9978 RepID=UPI002714CE11|nr:nesprin-3 [Ochotona princeps]